MRHFSTAILAVLCITVAAGSLTGCGIGSVTIANDAPVSAASGSMQPIAGSVYGGHAPLVGAHVYMVQPGTTGYGSLVTSMLTRDSGNVYCNVTYPCTYPNGVQTGGETFPRFTNGAWKNSGWDGVAGSATLPFASDQFVPAVDAAGQPFKGVLSDAVGQFYITGDYTCTVGQPVLLIAYGGAPSYVGSGSGSTGTTQTNTFAVTNALTYNNGSTGVYLTYTTSTQQLFYVGETVSVTGAPGGAAGFNQSGTVLASAPTSSTTTQNLDIFHFSIFVPYNATLTSATPSGLVYTAGQTVTANPTQITNGTTVANFNPAATNMMVLGNCPASGNFTSATATAAVTASSSSSTIATLTAANAFSPGQKVTLAGFTGSGTVFNGLTVTIATASSTKITFPFTTPVVSGGTGTASGPGAPLSFVYMNEVSTAATAYSFAGFVNTGTTNLTGNDEFHIGAPNVAVAQAAIANASVTAANLYDIQGSSVSTSFAGEGHIGRTATPSGTGMAPQANLDTIGNILAACVDSPNTYRYDLGAGTQSTVCKVLGQYAQDNGIYDTTVTTHQAVNIAQAAFNMARFPQGAGTGTTSAGVQTVTPGTSTTASNFVTALYSLPTGNVPFTPNLTALPNDFSLPIAWQIGTQVSDVQIDSFGNAWGAAGTAGMYELTPAGILTNYTAPAGFSTALSTNVAIDGVTGNVWAPGPTGVYIFTPGNTAGTQVGIVNSTLGGSIALDSLLNQYIPSGNDGIGVAALVKQNSAGTAAGGVFPVLGTAALGANSAGICATAIGYAALDKSNNIWTATSNNTFNGTPYVCRFDNNGNLTYSFAVPTGVANQAGGFGFPRGLATDVNDNAFFADKNLDAIYRVNQGSTANNSGTNVVRLAGRLSAPKNVAIDGANTLWAANSGDLNATTGPKYATGLVQLTTGLGNITSSYITGDYYSATPGSNGNTVLGKSLSSVAIDAGGNVWSAQGVAQGSLASATLIYEFVGLATPTVTPIAAAKATGTVGAKPGLTTSTISAYSLTGGVFAATIASPNAFPVGEVVSLSGFVTSGFLNGHSIKITSYVNSQNIRGTFNDGYSHADVAVTGEAGAASGVN